MKKLGIYYAVHAVINAMLLIVLHNRIILHHLSIAPLVLMAMMGFNILLFKEGAEEETNYGNTAYTPGNTGTAAQLTFEERKEANGYFRSAFLLMLPFEIPFVFFLPSYFKLFSLVPCLLAYILGGVITKRKMRGRIQKRLEEERRDLQEQKRREELGLK